MITKRTVKDFLTITLGTLIVACAVYFFMLPSHVTIGSGTALAMVLSNFIPLPVSVRAAAGPLQDCRKQSYPARRT